MNLIKRFPYTIGAILIFGALIAGLSYWNHQADECKSRGGQYVQTWPVGYSCVQVKR